MSPSRRGDNQPLLSDCREGQLNTFSMYHLPHDHYAMMIPSLIPSPDPPNFIFPARGILFCSRRGKLRSPRHFCPPARANGSQPREGTRHQFPAPLISHPLGCSPAFLKSRMDQQENKILFLPQKQNPTQEPNGNGAIEIQCKMDLQLL